MCRSLREEGPEVTGRMVTLSTIRMMMSDRVFEAWTLAVSGWEGLFFIGVLLGI